jgi:hypothetical protein
VAVDGVAVIPLSEGAVLSTLYLNVVLLKELPSASVSVNVAVVKLLPLLFATVITQVIAVEAGPIEQLPLSPLPPKFTVTLPPVKDFDEVPTTVKVLKPAFLEYVGNGEASGVVMVKVGDVVSFS